MNTNALERHITDTVKEWQMKIGYRSEEMKLYYPDVSLAGLLELSEGWTEASLKEALQEFSEETKERLGGVQISNAGDRYCVAVPAEGCTYIHENEPDSAFLRSFLGVITGLEPSMQAVEQCFADAAAAGNETYVKEDREAEGLGIVFYFCAEKDAKQTSEDSQIDAYVYCVEEDDFGITYHRFSWPDFQKLISEKTQVKHQAETCIMCQ